MRKKVLVPEEDGRNENPKERRVLYLGTTSADNVKNFKMSENYFKTSRKIAVFLINFQSTSTCFVQVNRKGSLVAKIFCNYQNVSDSDSRYYQFGKPKLIEAELQFEKYYQSRSEKTLRITYQFDSDSYTSDYQYQKSLPSQIDHFNYVKAD